jgi:phosphoesterase RecJ-like protein
VAVPNDYPAFLKWLPFTDDLMIFDQDPKGLKDIINRSTCIVALDYNDLKRVFDMETSIRNSGARKVLVDHHLQPVLDDFDKVVSKIDVSSTAELVYEVIEQSKLIDQLDRDIAECLLVGIMTDTGSFSYACNYQKTFEAVAEFVRLGVDVEKVHRKVYDTFSEQRLRLLGYCLGDKLTIIKEYSTAYISLSREELQRFNYKPGDTEGIVNYALSIKGIKLAAFFTERENKIRISFRSKDAISVNELAREHFLGGGHKNAAGGDSFDSLENTIERFKSVLPQYKDILSNA